MRGRRAAIADRDACMECGACVVNCASEALTVRPGVGCAFTVVKSFFGRSPAPERDTV